MVDLEIVARSGPAGEHPTGRIVDPGVYSGFVTCLVVSGDRAAVVSVGQRAAEDDPGREFLWYTFAPPGEGLLRSATGDGPGPDCKSLSLEGEGQLPISSEIAIWDSP